jgi:hypothetical protein
MGSRSNNQPDQENNRGGGGRGIVEVVIGVGGLKRLS